MRTIGVDLSSQDANTAICSVSWDTRGATVSALAIGVSDSDLRAAILDDNVATVGIDVPFGWPAAFVLAISAYSAGVWPVSAVPSNLRLRVTDRYIHEQTGLCPLSVSADRIAMPAMRAARLLGNMPEIDVLKVRSGVDARLIEVYPAAALRRWVIPTAGYKKRTDEGVAARQRILSSLQARLPFGLNFLCRKEAFIESDHALDALLSAVIARCYQLALTDLPRPETSESLYVEGWIALPYADALERLRSPKVGVFSSTSLQGSL